MRWYASPAITQPGTTMQNGSKYRGSMPGTTGHKSTNTMPNPNNPGPMTGVRQEKGKAGLGPITGKNPYPNGMS